jgi:hypothetical protein
VQENHIRNDEQENHSINEDPVLATHSLYDNINLLSTGEINEEVLSPETVIKQGNENETTPVINEYDLLNNGIDLRYSNSLRNFVFFLF